MKREMDLIRAIVLAVEDHPHGFAPHDITIDGYSAEQIGHHNYLHWKEGYVEGFDLTSLSDTSHVAGITSLTWKGHEFADLARGERGWAHVMKLVREKGDTVSIGVLVQLLSAYMKNSFGLN